MFLRRFICLSILIICSYIQAVAQSGDIRLSPEIYRANIPAEARLQAAARLGETMLVVWGSAVDEAEKQRSLLYAQIVRGGEGVGMPLVISSGAALLAGYLRVLHRHLP